MFNHFKNKYCAHKKINSNIVAGYCPDCGEYIKNQWYIARCNCCKTKQKTVFNRGQIFAETNFCRNCGSNSFTIEKLEKINIVDINYAVILKQVIKNKNPSFTQTWVEPNNNPELKLLNCKTNASQKNINI